MSPLLGMVGSRAFGRGGLSVSPAPTIGIATGGISSASITFTPVGTSATSFLVTSSPGGLTGTGSSSPITVSGLTNGTSYSFTVQGVNSAGNSLASSASNSVTPVKATGGSVSYSGGYAYHYFSSNGTFTPLTSLSTEYVVVGGGGGGSGQVWDSVNGGGGGGGQVKTGSGVLSSATGVAIGGGGTGSASGPSNTNPGGSSGSSSSFNGTSANPGLGGHAWNGGVYPSRGGASGELANPGNGMTNNNSAGGGGGGGAAGYSGWGGNSSGLCGGGGGAGASWNGYTFGGGGGGGGNGFNNNCSPTAGGSGGGGGGGCGVSPKNGAGGSTGGGGGGGGDDNGAGGNGGSGIVVIRYSV